jgi:hypothetical protein
MMVSVATIVAFHAHPDDEVLLSYDAHVHGRGSAARLFRVMVALPLPVFGLLFGREWFAEPVTPAPAMSDDRLPGTPHRPKGDRGPVARCQPGARR